MSTTDECAPECCGEPMESDGHLLVCPTCGRREEMPTVKARRSPMFCNLDRPDRPTTTHQNK